MTQADPSDSGDIGPRLVTVGHGRLGTSDLPDLLRAAGLEQVVDIRRYPGSRTNEAAGKDVLPALVEGVGIAYRWDERLGGRRRLTAEENADPPDPWWQVSMFGAYAAWTRSAECRDAFATLVDGLHDRRTAVLCSETLWWRCHRRLVADVVELEHGVPVWHLMHDGSLRRHRVAGGARLAADGVRWDVLPTERNDDGHGAEKGGAA